MGETVSLSQVFDFALYDVISFLLNSEILSQTAVVLVNAKDKFETLTENDEYLFDESKDVKQEIMDIKSLLKSVHIEKYKNLIDDELVFDSPFIYTALEYSDNCAKIRALLNCPNQTIVLKSIEVLKKYKVLTLTDKSAALKSVQDENIKNIILAI